jgi:hypothetical protein
MEVNITRRAADVIIADKKRQFGRIVVVVIWGQCSKVQWISYVSTAF